MILTKKESTFIRKLPSGITRAAAFDRGEYIEGFATSISDTTLPHLEYGFGNEASAEAMGISATAFLGASATEGVSSALGSEILAGAAAGAPNLSLETVFSSSSMRKSKASLLTDNLGSHIFVSAISATLLFDSRALWRSASVSSRTDA